MYDVIKMFVKRFEDANEIIKTLKMGNVKCTIGIDKILKSPILPPLSYTNDYLRFLAILRYWRGNYIVKECARAYRKIIRMNLEERNKFWWSVQELLYREKASPKVINAYLRRLKRNYKKIIRTRRRIARRFTDWLLPMHTELIVGLLPPRIAMRIITRTMKALTLRSDYLEKLGVSIQDVAFEIFEKIYKISLMDLNPMEKYNVIEVFVESYLVKIMKVQ